MGTVNLQSWLRLMAFDRGPHPAVAAAMGTVAPAGPTNEKSAPAGMISQMMSHEAAAFPRDTHRPSGTGNRIAPARPIGGWIKRGLDLAIALTALLLAAPIMVIIAIVLRATTGGSAIFAHRRVGFDGKPFDCYKFRTMVMNGQDVLAEHLARNPEAAAEWERCHKLRRDPRITFFGYILRKSSLDELPQLFNVLKGEMSCVGPRPIVADELPRYGEQVSDYLRVRPGLTGLWQVTGRSSTDYASRIALDSQYVRGWSIGTDLVILLRTVVAVMRFDQAS
ncbi:sugar transferase [Pararhizobium haloflavum]|uniref:sugar transferase n=1 Tax=Pararhizobium haloflavum TaxID=2037914 RepID=UPI001FE0C63D|nr:sugar transferase [Pararhizobium haloflavum]